MDAYYFRYLVLKERFDNRRLYHCLYTFPRFFFSRNCPFIFDNIIIVVTTEVRDLIDLILALRFSNRFNIELFVQHVLYLLKHSCIIQVHIF